MRRFLVLASIGLGFCWAQPGAGSRPAPSNVGSAQYPRINSDLSVTFQLKAPGAQKVQLIPPVASNSPSGLGKSPYDMVKDKDGVWTVTTPPVVPGFHYYWFLVDGLQVNDPGSETFYGFNQQTSGRQGITMRHLRATA